MNSVLKLSLHFYRLEFVTCPDFRRSFFGGEYATATRVRRHEFCNTTLHTKKNCRLSATQRIVYHTEIIKECGTEVYRSSIAQSCLQTIAGLVPHIAAIRKHGLRFPHMARLIFLGGKINVCYRLFPQRSLQQRLLHVSNLLSANKTTITPSADRETSTKKEKKKKKRKGGRAAAAAAAAH